MKRLPYVPSSALTKKGSEVERIIAHLCLSGNELKFKKRYWQTDMCPKSMISTVRDLMKELRRCINPKNSWLRVDMNCGFKICEDVFRILNCFRSRNATNK